MLSRRSVLASALTVAAVPRAKGWAASRMVSTQDLALIDLLTWGATPSALDEFLTLGRDQWLRWQLAPSPQQRLPFNVQQQIDALPVSHHTALELGQAFEAQGRAANKIADPDARIDAKKQYQKAMAEMARQASSAFILRALYSPDQLRERMTWFWFNHFNVYQAKGIVRVLVGDYEENAIRQHAMGHFRDLLMATLRHPAMLRFLDNADNKAGHINENYAREIMELHTMGVSSGYTQQDVEQLARILTGAGIDFRPTDPKVKPEWQPLVVREGAFLFNPARHDFSDKVFLGHTIKGSGFSEIEQAVDILCAHPATARHIAHRLALYFVADEPSGALVARMAKRFTESNGHIPSVLDEMIRSPEFTASLGTRFKDPVRYVYSAVRSAFEGRLIVNPAPIQGWLNRLSEGLYNRLTPDGYPLDSTAWSSSGQMMARFDIAHQIGSGAPKLFSRPDEVTVGEITVPQLQQGPYFEAWRTTLSRQTRTALEKATSPQEWNTLFLSSPEFMS
ncbi:DUF1800 domain-containing protein [Acetobacter cibinongensis]|uniref:DUF1800 domain-containing protein n=1 Tax=Acetobacter cibinongensis TaxID=146475 RepID=A0A1Z5YVM4_9PROT|nr:DUF1800 domain-containing protein [Acetobacter cibinongensis]OUJ02936.1 hypothetical protein HK14_03900 [Acetobacter cibinongensis]